MEAQRSIGGSIGPQGVEAEPAQVALGCSTLEASERAWNMEALDCGGGALEPTPVDIEPWPIAVNGTDTEVPSQKALGGMQPEEVESSNKGVGSSQSAAEAANVKNTPPAARRGKTLGTRSVAI